MLGDQDSQFQWFEFETRMRKLIKDVMVSYEKQMTTSENRIMAIEKENEANEDRLKEIEFLLYKSDEKQSRFDDIHDMIATMESSRRKDLNIYKNDLEDFKKLIFDKVFIYDSKFQKIDTFEEILSGAIRNYEEIDRLINEHKTQVMEELTQNLTAQNEQIKIKSEEVTQATTRIVKIEPKLTYFSQEILKLEQVDRRQQELLDQVKEQIEQLQDTKMDLKTHNEFRELLDERQRVLTENFGISIDRMLNNENYLEKYTPIYTQRMINDTLEQILKRKQKKKLIKYNEIKMPLLLQPIFEDVGIPNLIKLQREFHSLIMRGFISEQQKIVKTHMQDDKERNKLKWQIQNQLPPVESLKERQDYLPIKNGINLMRRSTIRDKSHIDSVNRKSSMAHNQIPASSAQRGGQDQVSEQASEFATSFLNSMQPNQTNYGPQNTKINVNKSLQKSVDPSQDPLYNPKREDYKGPYDINNPRIINMQSQRPAVSDEELKEEILRELYQDEGVSEPEEGGMREGIDEEDNEGDQDDTYDFEQQLKKDITDMVSEKLETFERRLKYLIETHEGSCKGEFKMYEQHIKEQVTKMTTYVQEVHANHIAEISNFKKEKNEQLIVNQMLVKKVQALEQWKPQQLSINDQFQTFGHCLENFVSIFKAIEMADNNFVMNVDGAQDDPVTLLNAASVAKDLAGAAQSAKKNIPHPISQLTQNDRSLSQTSQYNLNGMLNGQSLGGIPEHNGTLTGNNLPQDVSIKVKKLITDRNQKHYSESTLQAIQHVLQRKRNFTINIVNNLTGESHRIFRNELFNEYKKIEELVEEAINNINLVREGEHTRIIKKNIFQISKTRQPSPSGQSDDEVSLNKAMDQRLNGSVLVQGSGASVLGPKSNKKDPYTMKQQSLNQTLSYTLNQTNTQAGLTLFNKQRSSQNPSNLLRKKGLKNPSRIEESESTNYHYRTLSGMTPTQQSFANKRSLQINNTAFNLEDSSVQMPTISNSGLHHQNTHSIMIHDGQLHTSTNANLNLSTIDNANRFTGQQSPLRIEKITTLPQINSALKKNE